MLKTDKNFIDAIHFFQDDMEIAATTIIAAGHILRFKIQAEGVAHFGTTAGLLAGTKCDTYQGCINSPRTGRNVY
ncbi:MAG: hypothetical protein PSU93_09095 [Methylobacter sp.]|uniref:EAL domain-containing protein n=1 Tax=Candidatus Methylobacter titanis TaxID=3053457 RepID=A0AA43Q452_9GAMM|nr:hypothetical protein [Candidatus Methylobacter titanis]